MAITRRGPQRYEIAIYQGRDANGKRLRTSEMFHGTLKAAKIREGELRRDSLVDRGKATGQTFAER